MDSERDKLEEKMLRRGENCAVVNGKTVEKVMMQKVKIQAAKFNKSSGRNSSSIYPSKMTPRRVLATLALLTLLLLLSSSSHLHLHSRQGHQVSHNGQRTAAGLLLVEAANSGQRLVHVAQSAPRFALEPPALVEYLNSSGTVIGCRAQVAWQQAAGIQDSSLSQWSGQQKLAPTAAQAGNMRSQSPPQQPSVTWHLVRRLPGDDNDVSDDNLSPDQSDDSVFAEEQILGARVRPDGSLQLDAGRVAVRSGANPEAVETYKCCLSNRYGRLCSRPVRARPIDDPSALSLEVFDEFALAGNSIALKCQAPGQSAASRHLLEPVAWLRDDKIIVSSATNPISYQPADTRRANNHPFARANSPAHGAIETAKYLMLADGALLIRNTSKQDASGTYKCRARHSITGQTLTSQIGGQLVVDDTRTGSGLGTKSGAEFRRDEPLVAWAQVDSDALLCVQVQSNPPAKFTWFVRDADENSKILPSDQVPELKPLGACLLIRQVQHRHSSASYLCEASGGGIAAGSSTARFTYRLVVSSGQLSAQLNLVAPQQPSSSAGYQQLQVQNSLVARSQQFYAQLQSQQQQQQQLLHPQLVQFGATAQLNCSITGESYDTIAWYREAQLVAVASRRPLLAAFKTLKRQPGEGDDNDWSLRVLSTQDKSPVGQRSNIKLVQPNVISIESFGLRDCGTYQCQVYTARLNVSRILHAELALGPRVHSSTSSAATTSTMTAGNSWQSLVASRIEHEHLRSVSAALQLELPLVKPVLITRFGAQTVHKKTQISLECSATALPSARFVWFLDRQPILASQVQQRDGRQMTLRELLDATPISMGDGQEYSSSEGLTGDLITEDIDWSLFSELEANIDQEAGNLFAALLEAPISDKRFRVSHQLVLPAGGSNGGQQPTVISQLNVSQATAADSGLYKCLALNTLGSAWHAAQIGVQGAGVELRSYQGSNVTLLAGASGRLQCPLVGYPLQRVDWFRGDQRLPVSHRQRVEQVRQGFGGQLEISNVDRAADAGIYTCRASLVAPTNSQPSERYDDLVGIVNTIVRAPPLIDAQSLPELVQTTEGMRTKLVCSVVAGDRPVDIRWLRRVNEPRDPTRRRQVTSGARLGSLKLAGYELMQNSASASVSDGGELGDSVTVHNLEDSCLLTFKQVSHSDAAEYLCVAQNEVSHSVRHTRLVVHVAPSWSREPPNELGVLLGSRLQIDCAAHGFPQPQVSWRRESAAASLPERQIGSDNANVAADSSSASASYVELVNNYRQRVQVNGSLLIEQVELADSGAYMCELANGIGTGLSKVVRVRVHAPPYFKQRAAPQTQLSQVGGRSELKCMAYGDQPMLIGWRKDDEVVDLVNDSRRRVISERRTPAMAGGVGSHALESTLSMQGLARNDSGQYVCVASNEFGTEESLVQLIVQEPPEAPNLMRPVRATSRQATLSFRPPYSGNSPIKRYAIYYKQLPLGELQSAASISLLQQQLEQQPMSSSFNESAPPGWQQVTMEAPLLTSSSFVPTINDSTAVDQQQSASASLSGQLVNLNLCCLEPFARYLVRVRAINEIGQSELSKAAQFSTDEEAIGGPPLDVGVEATGAHSLKVRWRAPARHLQNGLIRGYYIGYRAISASTSNIIIQQSQSVVRSRSTHQIFPPAGLSSPSVAAAANTDLANNGEAEQYQYKNVQLELAGLVAAPGAGNMNGDLDIPSASNQMPQVFTSYLTNLRRKTTYSIIVQAYNKVGAGPRSDQILVSTLDAAPPISPQLRVVSVSYNSAVFTWSARRRFNTPASGQHNGNSSTSNMHKQHQVINHYRQPFPTNNEIELDDDERSAAADDDDPQSYYTINYRADPLTVSSSATAVSSSSSSSLSSSGPLINENEPEWQQQRVQRHRATASQSGGVASREPNYVLGNLRCGSRHTAYMTATNSLGQSEPGDQVKFATLGAAPVAPVSARDLLEVNTTFIVLKLSAWQNAGCLISSFLVKFRPSNQQVKWSILEHQVHPTIQTVTIAGSALFSTRPLALATDSARGPISSSADGLMDLPARGGNAHLASIVNKHQSMSDLVLRNLAPGSVYRLLVEATSEAGNTLAEYELDTGNLTSSTIAVTVNGLSVQERAAAARGGRARGDDPLAVDLLPSLSLEDGSPASGNHRTYSQSASGWQRYTFGVWSLTVLFVVASACMAGTALVLGYRSLMRVKPSRDGLVSALLCCSAKSNASSAGSSAGDSSNSHASSTAGTCYQVPERSEAAAYLRCATASQQHLHLSGAQQLQEHLQMQQQQHQQQSHYNIEQPLPLHIQQAIDSLADSSTAADLYGQRGGAVGQLVTSSSLSTIGGHLAAAKQSTRGQLRGTHTLASSQLRRRLNQSNHQTNEDLSSSSAADHLRSQYAATLGKQYLQRNSSFIHNSSNSNNAEQQHNLLKYNTADMQQQQQCQTMQQCQQQQQTINNIYGRLQNQALSSFQLFQQTSALGSSSGGTTSGYETGNSPSAMQQAQQATGNKQLIRSMDLDDCHSSSYLQCLRSDASNAYQMNLYGISDAGQQSGNSRSTYEQQQIYMPSNQTGDLSTDQQLQQQQQQFHYNVPNILPGSNKDQQLSCAQLAVANDEQLAAYGMLFAQQNQQ